MNLDNLKFRKLENGYTVKYHIAKMADPLGPDAGKMVNGFGGELYVENITQLKACVLMLIDKHSEAA